MEQNYHVAPNQRVNDILNLQDLEYLAITPEERTLATRFDYTIPLLPGHSYHIYNRGNAQDWIFYQERNYGYFLKKYFQYLEGFVKTFAYCLLRNH